MLRRDKTFQLRIDLLKQHLQLYEKVEAENYDAKKSERIVELEGLLNQHQETINKQIIEISNLKLNNLPPNIISNGPYDELSSGKTILELLKKMAKEAQD